MTFDSIVARSDETAFFLIRRRCLAQKRSVDLTHQEQPQSKRTAGLQLLADPVEPGASVAEDILRRQCMPIKFDKAKLSFVMIMRLGEIVRRPVLFRRLI